MKILLTGNKGFVGSHIQQSLEAEGHEIVGLEVHPTFKEWVKEMCRVVDLSIEAVIHAGAIPYNQSKDPKLFLWNAHASYLLAWSFSSVCGIEKESRPFIFFSTFLVSSTQNDWEERTAYGWSKWCAEDYIQQWMPNATILRPAVQWGDEFRKSPESRSVPYQLATHQLEYLFRNWGRSYVHILDVCQAIKVCLKDKPAGVFELHTEQKTNEQLAEIVDWEGYEWVGDPQKKLGYTPTYHREINIKPILPNWHPTTLLSHELPRMEKERFQCVSES